MNAMKKLLSVFVVLAMLLSFAACDSSKKKNDDDDEDEDESEETVELNNDFEGKYEGKIDFVDFYCFALNYPTSDTEDFAEDMKDYSLTAIFDIKEDTLDISFDCKDKDIEEFVNDFYTAVAESMFEEDEIEDKMAEAEEQIESEIDSLKDMADETEDDIEYEFDGESELTLTLDGEDIEMEIDFGKKKFTVESAECTDSDFDLFANMFVDVTFKKVANYDDGKKDDDDESSKDESEESKNEEKPSNRPTDTPSFSETPDESQEESSVLVPDEPDEPVVPDVPTVPDASVIVGTYTGEVNLLDLYYIMYEYDEDIYAADEYMDYYYVVDSTLTITQSTVSITISPDDETINAFIDALFYAACEMLVEKGESGGMDADALFAANATTIAQDKVTFKSFVEEFYLINCSYTYDAEWEEMTVSVNGQDVLFSLFVYSDYIEVYTISDDNGGNVAANLSTVFKGVEFNKN